MAAISDYWRALGKTEADKRPGRTFESSHGLLCNECCNGDRCDDRTHFARASCPFCLGTGTNARRARKNDQPEHPMSSNPRCAVHGTVLNAKGICLICDHPELCVGPDPMPALMESTQPEFDNVFSETQAMTQHKDGMSKYLRPCPFCGGAPVIHEPSDGPHAGGVFIECATCRASSALMYPEKCDARPLVAEQWNSRAALASPAPAAAGEGEGTLERACRQWLIAHDENMHLLSLGTMSTVEVKTAVGDGIKAIRAALAAADSRRP